MKIRYEIDDSLMEDEIVIKVKQLTEKLMELQKVLNSNELESIFGVKDKKKSWWASLLSRHDLL